MRQLALVTGAAGFLGSHVVDALLDFGYQVVGLDDLSTGSLDNLCAAGRNSRFDLQIADVRYAIGCRPNLIFNLACPASPVQYSRDPARTFTTSVLGAQRVAEAARDAGCRVVHASSSEVYGMPQVHPQTEDYRGSVDTMSPRACYSEGKRAAETVMSVARDRWHVDVRVVRIFNCYGPRMALGDGRVVPTFVHQALTSEDLVVYGDGQQTRSFMHSSDFVSAFVRIGTDEELILPPALNLGNPEEVPIGALARKVVKLCHSKSQIKICPELLPAGDAEQRCPDVALAKAALDWAPAVPLEQGLAQVVEEIRRRLAKENAQ